VKLSCDLCGQELCVKEATHAMYWPGAGRSLLCQDHKWRAEWVAAHMGFHLVIEPLKEEERSS
jgi:hypothetical protein